MNAAPTFVVLGAILGAAYMLTMYLRVFFGRVTQPQNNKLADLSLREMAVMVPFVAMIFLMGLKPGVFFDPMQSSINRALADYEGAIQQLPAVSLESDKPAATPPTPAIPVTQPAAAPTAPEPAAGQPGDLTRRLPDEHRPLALVTVGSPE